MRFLIPMALSLTLLLAQPKEALLIGNSHYKYISNLKNPSYNLNRLKKTLEDLGFNVKIKTDLDSVHLEESIEVFAKRLARSRDTIGFLYYTGHGCQVAHQGYLLPTNVDSQDRLKVKHHALNINEMIERLKDAGNRVNMFFLDACRDVPTSTKGGSKGLGQIKNTPKGTLVVYATKAGEVAEDNSDFINSIIKSIKEPNQSIRNLPYSISDRFTQMSTSQMPIFSAVGIPKVVLNEKNIISYAQIKILYQDIYAQIKNLNQNEKDLRDRVENLIEDEDIVNYTSTKSVNKIERLNNKLVIINQKFNRIKTNQEKYNRFTSEYKKIEIEYLKVIREFGKQKLKCQNLEDIYKKQKEKLDKRVVKRQSKNIAKCYENLEILIYSFEDMSRDFAKLKNSINTLNDVRETDRASIRSLEKQKKVIESMIRMEKRVDTFPLQEEVERTIDAM